MTSDDLRTYLDSLQREPLYRVEKVLKKDSASETQVVYCPSQGGAPERGPFVRKIMDAGLYDGKAYQLLFDMQRQGVRVPHVPAILECYRTESRFVVVTEFVGEETLEDLVLRRGASDEAACEVVSSCFLPLCDAVQELHTRFETPLIHRDLKPSNVVVGARLGGGAQDGNAKRDGGSSDAACREVYLVDFGISRLFSEGASSDTTHFGTRAYAPPEQFGFGQTDVRTDVYALGKLLQFCITGKEPAACEPSLGELEGDAPMWQIIRKATSLDPKDRFASVAELKRAVGECLAGKPLSFAGPTTASTLTPTPAPAFTPTPSQPHVGGQSQGKRLAPGSVQGAVQYEYSSVDLERKGFFSDAKTAARVLWNALVILAWLIIVAASVMEIASSSQQPQSLFPLPIRILEFAGMLIIPSGLVCYLLLFRKRLRRRIPLVSGWPLWVEILVVLVVALAVFGITFGIVIAYAYANGIY